MANNETATGARDVPQREPGVLIGVEWYKDGPVKLEDDEKTALKSLCSKLAKRDMAARREEIILDWKKHLYDRGLQFILPTRNGGWQLPAPGTGYNPQDENSRCRFIVNIYNSYSEIIISALTREVPKARWEPGDPNNDVDITTAEGAEKLESRIDRDNNLKQKMQEMARFLWLDCRAIFFTSYMLDGQQFGYHDPKEEALEDETVPEDEEAIAAQENEGGPAPDDDEETDGGSAEQVDDEPAAVGDSGRKPKGHEVICAEGALEWQLPIKANFLCECPWVRRSKEIDLQIAKARYADVADKITPSQGGPSGDDIDRLARMNIRLGVLENFNTSDSQIYDVTEDKYFLRPAALLEVEGDDVCESLLKKFQMGCYVTFCGDVLCTAFNHSMDDHLTLVFGKSGDGAHRPGLGDWLIPIQEVLNDEMSLAYDYFMRGVPRKWMDNEMFNVSELKDQKNVVGGVSPFDREQGVQMSEVIFEETPIAFPPELLEHINLLIEGLPQLLCGAYPALSGGGDSSPTDTLGGMMVQRDQALGRVGLPWRQIKEGIAKVKEQVVRMLAQNQEEDITIPGTEAVTVELKHMKGNFRAFAEVDENFPSTYTQKQNQIQKLMEGATTSPQIAEFLYSPDNVEELIKAIGIPNFYVKQVAARDKQLGEATLLLKGSPLPNPAVQQAKEQAAAIVKQTSPNPAAAQAATPQLAQITQQATTLLPEVSSIPIDEQCDDHETESEICWKIINSPRGREMKNGTPEEQEGFQNLRLHYLEHMDALAKKQAQQQKPTKPPSVSIALKDLPPPEAAAAANAAGLGGNAKDFEQQDVAEAVAKHPASIVQ